MDMMTGILLDTHAKMAYVHFTDAIINVVVTLMQCEAHSDAGSGD